MSTSISLPNLTDARPYGPLVGRQWLLSQALRLWQNAELQGHSGMWMSTREVHALLSEIEELRAKVMGLFDSIAVIRHEIEREEHQDNPDVHAIEWLRMRLQQELNKQSRRGGADADTSVPHGVDGACSLPPL